MTLKKPFWLPDSLKKRVMDIEEFDDGDNIEYVVYLAKPWVCKHEWFICVDNAVEFRSNDTQYIQKVLSRCIEISNDGWEFIKKKQTELDTINAKISALETKICNEMSAGNEDVAKNMLLTVHELYDNGKEIKNRIDLAMSMER